MFVGYNTLVAVISFNDGAMGRAAVFKKLNLDIGRNTQKALVLIDKARIRKAEKAAEAIITKEGRIRKRQQKRKREDAEQETSADYGPGEF